MITLISKTRLYLLAIFSWPLLGNPMALGNTNYQQSLCETVKLESSRRQRRIQDEVNPDWLYAADLSDQSEKALDHNQFIKNFKKGSMTYWQVDLSKDSSFANIESARLVGDQLADQVLGPKSKNPWSRVDESVKSVLGDIYQRTLSMNRSKQFVRKVLSQNNCNPDVVEEYSTKDFVEQEKLWDIQNPLENLQANFTLDNKHLVTSALSATSGDNSQNDYSKYLAPLEINSKVQERAEQFARSNTWEKIEYSTSCAPIIETAEGICSGKITPQLVYKKWQEQLAKRRSSKNKNQQDGATTSADCSPETALDDKGVDDGATNPGTHDQYGLINFKSNRWPSVNKKLLKQFNNCRKTRQHKACNIKQALQDLKGLQQNLPYDSTLPSQPSTSLIYKRRYVSQGLPPCFYQSKDCKKRQDTHLKENGFDGGLDEYCQTDGLGTTTCGPMVWTAKGPKPLQLPGQDWEEQEQKWREALENRDNPDHVKAAPLAAVPILIGAGIGATGGAISAGMTNGWDLEAVGKGFTIGAVGGALAVVTAGKTLIYSMATGGMISVGSDVTIQVVVEKKHLSELDPKRMGLAFGLGSLSGGLGQAVGNVAHLKTPSIGYPTGSTIPRQAIRQVAAGATTSSAISTTLGVLAADEKCLAK